MYPQFGFTSIHNKIENTNYHIEFVPAISENSGGEWCQAGSCGRWTVK